MLFLFRIRCNSLSDSKATKMNHGYIYCFSNTERPGELKIGMTERTPDIRLREANSSTWALPTFVLEFAKKVDDPKEIEKKIHAILSVFARRIHPKREFFEVSLEKVMLLFDLIEGEYWTNPEDEDDVAQSSIQGGSRDMSKCFTHGQQIRHMCGIDIWVGVYDSTTNTIGYDGTQYTSLSGFAKEHYRTCKPDRQSANANGWKECECVVDEKWISTFNL